VLLICRNEAQAATSKAKAVIVGPITVSVISDLKFGLIIPSTTNNGTVTITPTGVRLFSRVTLIDTSSFGAATFLVDGSSSSFTIGLPYWPIKIYSGINYMTVGTFTKSSNTTLDAQGNGSFTVGAKLTVPKKQPTGSYSGTFNVTVSFQ
jgi:hypothetical protein